jgi:hypothetical protein
MLSDKTVCAFIIRDTSNMQPATVTVDSVRASLIRAGEQISQCSNGHMNFVIGGPGVQDFDMDLSVYTNLGAAWSAARTKTNSVADISLCDHRFMVIPAAYPNQSIASAYLNNGDSQYQGDWVRARERSERKKSEQSGREE